MEVKCYDQQDQKLGRKIQRGLDISSEQKT